MLDCNSNRQGVYELNLDFSKPTLQTELQVHRKSKEDQYLISESRGLQVPSIIGKC